MSTDIEVLKPQTVRVMGTPIALIDRARFLEIVEQWLARKNPRSPGVYICFRDVHGVIRSQDDPVVRLAHEKSLFNAPDGMPLVWVARHRSARRRGAKIDRVCGPDMLAAVARFGQSKGWRHAFIGGAPPVLEKLTASLRAHFPQIVIAEAVSPPFRPLHDSEVATILDRLRAAKPDFVWVGLGCPKQESWMLQHAHAIPGAISLGVGAAFDIWAGAVPRAPNWLQRFGFEWLYRLVKEPRRLGRRYLSVIPRFLFGLAIEELQFLARIRHSQRR